MCFHCKKEKPQYKQGNLYNMVRHKIRPFDTLFFQGADFVSKTIMSIERFNNLYERSGDFSHVGMVVTSDILQNDLVEPGKLYIWESILGGKLGYDVKNLHGKTQFGVQLRDFDKLIVNYDKPNDTAIAYGSLITNPLDYQSPVEVKNRFTLFFNQYNGEHYDANLYSLFSAIIPCMRPCRSKVEDFCKTNEWLFCSELVAMAYKYMRIYPEYVDPKTVIPRDIAYPKSDTDKMPYIFKNINYITTLKHYHTL